MARVRSPAMARTGFAVVYDGPALADGEMPVRDLAPALLALGALFTEASTVLYPDLEPPALSIKATERASFDVSLILDAADIWDQIVKLFTSPDVNALVNLRDAIIVSGGGLFYFIQWRKKRRITREEQLDTGQVRITLEDGTVAEFPAETMALHRRVSVRKKAQQVVNPIGRPGVDRLEFRSESQVTLSIGPDDVSAFDPEPEEPPPLLDEETGVVLAIVSAVFKEGNKWRFSDGAADFAAAIEDPAFIERVNAGEPFAAGDRLRCRIRIIQTEKDGKLHIERRVLEVLEHVRRPQADPLFLPEADDEDEDEGEGD